MLEERQKGFVPASAIMINRAEASPKDTTIGCFTQVMELITEVVLLFRPVSSQLKMDQGFI